MSEVNFQSSERSLLSSNLFPSPLIQNLIIQNPKLFYTNNNIAPVTNKLISANGMKDFHPKCINWS